MNNLIPEEPNVHLKNEPFCCFQAHLYEVFIIQKRYRVDDVAKKMRISPDLLYRYIRGDKRFPIARFLDYLKSTADLDILKYFAREVGLCLVPRVKSEKVASLFNEIAGQLQNIADLGNGEEKR